MGQKMPQMSSLWRLRDLVLVTMTPVQSFTVCPRWRMARLPEGGGGVWAPPPLGEKGIPQFTFADSEGAARRHMGWSSEEWDCLYVGQVLPAQG